MGSITAPYETFRPSILKIGGSFQSGKESSGKGTIGITAQTPHLVLFQLPT
jgi:hypothetical protein